MGRRTAGIALGLLVAAAVAGLGAGCARMLTGADAAPSGAALSSAAPDPGGAGAGPGPACRNVCNDDCCPAGAVCTAGRCAAPGACEREIGPTSTRVADVALSEVARAVKKAKPGTEIVLAPGTWTQPLVIRGRGAPDAPVVVSADPPGSVRFSGAGRLEIGGDYVTIRGFDFDGGVIPKDDVVVLFRGCRHCRLTDSKIRRYRPAQGDALHWVRFTTGHHNRLDHSEIHDKSDLREMVRVTNFSEGFDRIDHNYLHDFIRDPPRNGGEAVRLGTNGTTRLQSEVDHNLFERIRAEQEIVSVKASANTLADNTFRDCYGELTVRVGDDNVVTGNVFIASPGFPGRGIRAYGRRNRIEDNQFAGVTSGIRLGSGTPDGSCYAAANDAIVRANRFAEVEQQEIERDFMLGWSHFERCPAIDVRATGQTIADNGGPPDLSRGYRSSDPCIGTSW